VTDPDELDRVALRRFTWAYRGCYALGIALMVALGTGLWRWVPDKDARLILTALILLLALTSMCLAMVYLERLHIGVDVRKRRQ